MQAGKSFGRGDDDLERASIRDGGDGVLRKPFNATVTGGDGSRPQNNRSNTFAASGQMDAIMQKELYNIIQAL